MEPLRCKYCDAPLNGLSKKCEYCNTQHRDSRNYLEHTGNIRYTGYHSSGAIPMSISISGARW